MNTKLRTLVQALVDEINEVKGEKDVRSSDWWKLINWHEPEMRTMYDSLSEDTRKLIINAGDCPECPEKKIEFPEAPKDAAEGMMAGPEVTAPCTELLKKEHPDWSAERIAEQCEKEEVEDAKKKKEAEKPLTPEEKKKLEEKAPEAKPGEKPEEKGPETRPGEKALTPEEKKKLEEIRRKEEEKKKKDAKEVKKEEKRLDPRQVLDRANKVFK